METDGYEKTSLALQFAASFCWAIGATMAGPTNAADFLQLLAAVSWCLANFASALAMIGGRATPSAVPSADRTAEGNVELASA